MSSCEYCEHFKTRNTYFEKHLQIAASEKRNLNPRVLLARIPAQYVLHIYEKDLRIETIVLGIYFGYE